jgi:hypothetical protein
VRATRALVTTAVVAALATGGLTTLAAQAFVGEPGTSVVAAGGTGGGTKTVDRPATIPQQPVSTPSETASPVITPQRNPPVMAQGSSGENVRELQVRLKHLGLFDADVTGYFGTVTKGAVAAYQESKGEEATGELYADVWTTLQAETPKPTTEELYPPPPNTDPPSVPPGALDPRCMTGRVLCIDKTERVLRWVVDGRPLLQMDARFGAKATPTREGQFSVYWKDRDHVSGLYESAMPDSMFFSGGQAVHYSADFAARGYAGASHGCVNIRDRAHLDWLFDQVNVGDKVVVYWS